MSNEPVGHSEVIYPAILPLHDLAHIVAAMRGIEKPTLPELGQNVATVTGCGCEMMKGKPQPVGAMAAPANLGVMSNSELADTLASVMAPQAGEGAEAFPWALVISLVHDALRRYFGF